MKRKKDKNFADDLIIEIKQSFHDRREERRRFESQWRLNTNFFLGNQYSAVNVMGEIDTMGRDYFWQEREVYNHIASIVETRLARLSRVKPKMSVRPKSGNDGDIKNANVATKILNNAREKLGLATILAKGAQWSEITGSVFYKLSWDQNGGRVMGQKDNKPIYEGEVRIDVCPPYEIFPSNIASQDIAECDSIIHAKCMTISEIEKTWGIIVAAEEVDTFTHDGVSIIGGLGVNSAMRTQNRGRALDSAIVLERYTKPSSEYPNGELAIVAGNKLLYHGDLPFRLGDDGGFALPFVKQDAQINPGCFYGISMIERAIPVQRAYNAVKNRKHEFMNRIAMGVLAVEDGSVDTENLEAEGLSPGKILVYRQGAVPPTFMNPGTIPSEFNREEDKLLSEFIMISGVSEVMRSSVAPGSNMSGMAIQLLLDMDDTRLTTTANRIRDAVKQIARFILRLYRQFAVTPRLSRVVGEDGDVELLHWKGSALSADDVILDTENEMSDSLASRKTMIFDLLNSGLLHDENGKLSDQMRFRILDMLGYGAWEHVRDTHRLHVARAQRENFGIGGLKKGLSSDIVVEDIDDHGIHIAEHTKFMLTSDFENMRVDNPLAAEKLSQHLGAHRLRLKLGSIDLSGVAMDMTDALNQKIFGSEEFDDETIIKEGNQVLIDEERG
ncbi:MAG: hypothetical protein FWE03_01435 [Firmicutes bacterium]|nr:hypothetical protein [Bacillota bacterium]